MKLQSVGVFFVSHMKLQGRGQSVCLCVFCLLRSRTGPLIMLCGCVCSQIYCFHSHVESSLFFSSTARAESGGSIGLGDGILFVARTRNLFTCIVVVRWSTQVWNHRRTESFVNTKSEYVLFLHEGWLQAFVLFVKICVERTFEMLPLHCTLAIHESDRLTEVCIALCRYRVNPNAFG